MHSGSILLSLMASDKPRIYSCDSMRPVLPRFISACVFHCWIVLLIEGFECDYKEYASTRLTVELHDYQHYRFTVLLTRVIKWVYFAYQRVNAIFIVKYLVNCTASTETARDETNIFRFYICTQSFIVLFVWLFVITAENNIKNTAAS